MAARDGVRPVAGRKTKGQWRVRSLAPAVIAAAADAITAVFMD